jgi:hypothetical protein
MTRLGTLVVLGVALALNVRVAHADVEPQSYPSFPPAPMVVVLDWPANETVTLRETPNGRGIRWLPAGMVATSREQIRIDGGRAWRLVRMGDGVEGWVADEWIMPAGR